MKIRFLEAEGKVRAVHCQNNGSDIFLGFEKRIQKYAAIGKQIDHRQPEKALKLVDF
jgi:hypothetical protein